MLLFLLILPGVLKAQNLVTNPSFETFSKYDCWSCNCTLSSDSHSGSHSYKVTNRQYEWTGPSQELTLTPDRTYCFTAWAKLLNTAPGKIYSNLDSLLDITDNNGKQTYVSTGVTPFITPGKWHVVGGDYYIPANTKTVRFSVKVPDPSVNFLVDDYQVTLIDHSYKFESDEDKRIDQLRKANLQMSLSGSAAPSGLSVEVQQVKSEFGWGSVINVAAMFDTSKPNYMKFFYDLFEWSVMEWSLKWTATEPVKDELHYDLPLKGVNEMLSKGIKVRGHNIFWGGPNVVPKWQKNMSGSQLKPLLSKHIQEMTSTFKGKFQHWDVENENLHLHFYEEKLQDPHITEWMFREVHKHDPHTQCFLNEYDVVAGGMTTQAYKDQGLQFKADGVPVAGMGIQSHLGPNFDLSVMKHRLDEVAEVGLPIWITELDIDEYDANKKAKKYADVLKLYFSHPAVHGVLFWGFSDQNHWRPNAAIANGKDVTPNAAGKKVQELLKHTWRTNETHNISHGKTVNIRAFKGSYKLLLHHNGKVIHTENFTVGNSGNSLKINISGTGSNPHVDHVIIG
ncbi:uncharacterized protein LOC126828654 isoform X1 [Patella vulgata]|uniref:uncharacterized protein LOC126828654 isoform X1 n=2 Tax=Patella vulgata TaxID=6465 RepID=UPI00217FC494|nr:uncharacterized protein LOC126828654 isoform X1 [Patella vulgata]